MPIKRQQNISYITDMAFELEKMAAATQNRFLALLFKMAAQEGKQILMQEPRYSVTEAEEKQGRPNV